MSEVTPLAGDPPRGVMQAVVGEATAMLPLAEVIDLAAERARLATAAATRAASFTWEAAARGHLDSYRGALA